MAVSAILAIITTMSDDDMITFDMVLERQFAGNVYRVAMDQTFDAYVTANDLQRLQNSEQIRDSVKIVKGPNHMLDKNFTDAIPQPDAKSVVVYPLFTAAAYHEPGFYTYFREQCNERCLTVSFENPRMGYTSSGNGAQILHQLGYEIITDVQVDLNPGILKEYDTVIVLHNEYLTPKMFDAFVSHPKLIFLYPNALFAEISVDYDDQTITLVAGHSYPDWPNGPGNSWGYEVEEEFHHYEFDAECLEWEFVPIENGYHLTCYPDALPPGSMLEIFKRLKELSQ